MTTDYTPPKPCGSSDEAVIAALKSRITQCIIDCDEAGAAEAHEDLVALEHEARIVATVRRYSSAEESEK